MEEIVIEISGVIMINVDVSVKKKGFLWKRFCLESCHMKLWK